MKKWISILLILCLLLPGSGALAMVVTATSETTSYGDVGESTSISALAAAGSQAWLLYSDGRLTALDPATRTETPVGKLLNSGYLSTQAALDQALAAAEGAPVPADVLFVADGALHALCTLTGQCYTLLDAAGAFAPVATVQTDAAIFAASESETRLTILDAAAVGGTLYLVTRDDSAGGLTTTLVGIDLASGQAKSFTVQNVQEAEAYADGQLLLRRYDMSALYAASTGGTAGESMPGSDYGTFDPAKDVYTQLGNIAGDGVLGAYSVSGMVYGAASGTLYYVNGSRVEGVDIATQTTRTSAFTGEGMFGNLGAGSMAAYVDAGFYLRGDSTGYKLLALDTDAVKQGALRIFGEFGSEAHKSFAINHPEIPVDVASDYTASIEAITNAMVSESDAYDVLLMIMSYMPVERLIQKGYFEDLSAYPEIMERIKALDPRFLESMTVEGKLYGVPVTSSAISYGVDLEQWEALGLTQADLPTDLVSFYEFIADYQYDYGEDHPEVRLFDMGGENLKMVLFSLMLDTYITYGQAVLGEDAGFDTPIIREVLTAFEAIDFEELAQATDMTDVTYTSKPYLFAAYVPVTSFSDYYRKITPLVLPLTADAQAVLGANLSVLAINTRSQRKEQAVQYICNYLDNLDDSSAIVLRPGDNEPRVKKDYDKQHQTLLDEIAKMQALLDAAEDSQKAPLQQELEEMNKALTAMEENKYSVSEEQITQFREKYSALLTVCQQSVLYGADESAQKELSNLMMQYLSGATTQDQLLKELDKRTRMMALENQ